MPAYARLTAALLLLLLSLSAARAEPIDFTKVDPADHTHDRWYLDTIGGKTAGYWRSWLEVDDRQIVTGYEEKRVEKHAGELMTSTTRVVWTETKDFKPVTIVVEQADGSDNVTQTYRFTDNGVELTSEQAGRTIKRSLPAIEGAYLTAAQREIAIATYLKREENTFMLKTLDPLVGMQTFGTRYDRSKDRPKPIELADGRSVSSTRWDVTFSVLPGFVMRSFIDKNHRTIGVSYDVGSITRVSRLADASVAELAFDPPEMAHLSVIVPDKPIDKPRQQNRIVYELAYDAGGADVLPASTSHQRVEQLGKGRVRVTVDLDAEPEATDEGDQPTDASLATSIRIDHRDPAVRALAAKAIERLGDDATGSDIALACKRMAAKHLDTATLSVGAGTASEAARTGKGDCTESSVLLAALLRAHGIPSRCVTGLVYTEAPFAGKKNVFVYHQWTQAWLEDAQGNGRWHDLDAAAWRYSAGHIALGVSNMGDNDQQDQFDIIPMMQQLKIKIIETSK